MVELKKNLVVEVPGFAKAQRILELKPTLDQVISINIDGRGSAPAVSKRSEWVSFINTGQLKVIPDPYTDLPLPHAVSPKMLEREQRAWKAIEPLVRNVEIYTAKARPALLKSRSDALKSQELGSQKWDVTILRDWLVEYWQQGCTPSALQGRRHNCGLPGLRKTSPQKLGRKRKRGDVEGMNVTDEIRKIFRVAVKSQYRTGKSLAEIYRYMLRNFFPNAVTVELGGDKHVITAPNHIPSLGQFYDWHERDEERFAEIRARLGQNYFDRNLRKLAGNSTWEAIGPGYRYQIDATIADVYLVSKIDRRRIIGRPVVYLVIDVWSRMVVGFHVGLESASWPVAMMALYNVTLDKVELCKRMGISISPEEWPNSALASVVLGDRGEMLSQDSDRLSSILRIDVQNPPPYRPDWKGIIERMFNTVQTKMKGSVTGYVAKGVKLIGERDYRLDAVLTLESFTKALVACIIEHNNTPVTGYPLSNELRAASVPAIPTALWAWGTENIDGEMVYHSDNKLLLALLPQDDARISGYGVEFKERVYDCEELDERSAHSLARLKGHGKEKVTVSYHPHNLDVILLHDVNSRRGFLVCTLNSDNPDDLGISINEMDIAIEDNLELAAKGEYVKIAHQLTRQARVEKLMAADKAAKKALGPDKTSATAKTKDIPANKMVEKLNEHLTNPSPLAQILTSKAPPKIESKPTPVKALPSNSVNDDDDTYDMPSIFDD